MAVLTVGAAASGVIANWPREEEPPPQYNNRPLAWQILEDMQRGLNRLVHEVRDTETKITNGIAGSNAYINSHQAAFVAARPDLATANAGNITGRIGPAYR